MPVCIIKPDRDVDGYVAWSSITDGPVAWGTRESVAEFLQLWDSEEAAAKSRFDRADELGTSFYDGTYGWASRGMLVLNGGDSHGWIPRSKIWEWLAAGLPNEMLEPLEED